jgi:hypothetical protein
MAKTYVGTADRYGLRSFVLEDQAVLADTATKLHSGAPTDEVPFWATVSEELASRVRQHLRLGERAEALVRLDAQAIEMAPLLPSAKHFRA